MTAKEKQNICYKMADSCAKLEQAMALVPGLFTFKHRKALLGLSTDIDLAIQLQSAAHQQKLELERKRELKAKSKITPV